MRDERHEAFIARRETEAMTTGFAPSPTFRSAPALAGLATALLAMLVGLLAAGSLEGFDAAVAARVEPLRSPALLAAFALLTQLGGGETVVLAAFPATAILLRRRERRLASGLWLCLAGAGLTTFALKHLLDRARPEFIEGFVASSPSFPSSHATAAMAGYAFLALALAPRMRRDAARATVCILAGVLVAAVAASRVVLGVHHASDVVAGLLVGLVWVALGACAAAPRSAGPRRTAAGPAGRASAAAIRSPAAGSSGASRSARPAPARVARAGA